MAVQAINIISTAFNQGSNGVSGNFSTGGGSNSTFGNGAGNGTTITLKRTEKV